LAFLWFACDQQPLSRRQKELKKFLIVQRIDTDSKAPKRGVSIDGLDPEVIIATLIFFGWKIFITSPCPLAVAGKVVGTSHAHN